MIGKKVFDLINVSEIHNRSIPSSSLLTNATLFQLRTLADTHEFNLAYNASDPIRAISGRTLSAQIISALNSTLTSPPNHAPKITIQFGAYGAFQSFFGLTNLPTLNTNASFTGIPDYASSMVFELVSNSTSPAPAAEETSIRFYFHNGTFSSNSSSLNSYPLFNSSAPVLIPWMDFVTNMNSFAIGDQTKWCAACGNTTGVCASSSPPAVGGGTGKGGGGGNGVSKPVAGVIGALVTLAVVLGLEAAVMVIAGLRVARKQKPAVDGNGGVQNGGKEG